MTAAPLQEHSIEGTYLVIRDAETVVEVAHPDGMLILQQAPLGPPLPWAPPIPRCLIHQYKRSSTTPSIPQQALR